MWGQLKKLCLVTALAILLPVPVTLADILCVKQGAGGDCGSPECSRCDATITSALAAALAGDTVRVAQGTYTENIAIDKNVVVEGGWDTDFSARNPQTYPILCLLSCGQQFLG